MSTKEARAIANRAVFGRNNLAETRHYIEHGVWIGESLMPASWRNYCDVIAQEITEYGERVANGKAGG